MTPRSERWLERARHRLPAGADQFRHVLVGQAAGEGVAARLGGLLQEEVRHAAVDVEQAQGADALVGRRSRLDNAASIARQRSGEARSRSWNAPR